MNCKCGARVKITNSYTTGAGRTARGECQSRACGKVYTLVTIFVCEATEEGQGAYALAKRLRRRRKPPTLEGL